MAVAMGAIQFKSSIPGHLILGGRRRERSLAERLLFSHRDRPARREIGAIEQPLPTFFLDPASFAKFPGSTGLPNSLASDRAIELQHGSVAILLPQRSIRVELDIADIGFSGHRSSPQN